MCERRTALTRAAPSQRAIDSDGPKNTPWRTPRLVRSCFSYVSIRGSEAVMRVTHSSSRWWQPHDAWHAAPRLHAATGTVWITLIQFPKTNINVSSNSQHALAHMEIAWLRSQQLNNLSLTADVQHVQISLWWDIYVTIRLPCLIPMDSKSKAMMHAVSCVSP